MIQVPMSKNSSSSPMPSALAMKPPTIAPTMPISIVTMMPPGSSPGRIAFAIAPASRPRTIQPMIPIQDLRPVDLRTATRPPSERYAARRRQNRMASCDAALHLVADLAHELLEYVLERHDAQRAPDRSDAREVRLRPLHRREDGSQRIRGVHDGEVANRGCRDRAMAVDV